MTACRAGSRPLLLPDGQREKSAADFLAGTCLCTYLEYADVQARIISNVHWLQNLLRCHFKGAPESQTEFIWLLVKYVVG